MSVVIMVLQLLLGLAILIILHELGHYLAARAFGIRIEKFFLFFDAWGVKFLSLKRGDTEFGIGWLPLGGYVKIAGMIDESMDKAQMALPPKSDEFRSKPAWQRLIVMLAGVTVNLIFGVLIFWFLTLEVGQTYVPMSAYTDGIVPGEALKHIGVKAGDHIVRMGSKPVNRNTDLMSSELFYGNIDLGLTRNGRDTTLRVPANFVEIFSKYSTDEPLFQQRVRSQIDSIVPSGHAAIAGLKKGDKIIGINGMVTPFWDQVQQAIARFRGTNLLLQVTRAGNTLDIHATTNAQGKLGLTAFVPIMPSKRETFTFFKAFQVGSTKAFGVIGESAKNISKIAKREMSPRVMSGPIGIARVYGADFDWVRFWGLTGILSMGLAFVNILPIPALDGGHALFLIIEMIKGKPLSDKFLESAQLVGFFIIMGLIIFQFGNDIMKIFVK